MAYDSKWDPFALRMIDIGSGIGGFSLGAKEAGFQTVAGMEIDPLAVSIYRSRVAPCWHGSILDAKEAHPPFPAKLVVSDLPTVPNIRASGMQMTFPVENAHHSMRIAVEAEAEAVLFVCVCGNITNFGDGGHPQVEYFENLCRDAGFPHTDVIVQDAADFCVPQYKKRLLMAGFRYKTAFDAFRWSNPTTDPRNRPTVQSTLGIPYPHPSPPVTASENKSSWKGLYGGSSPPRRASEIIAGTVGRAAWEGPVALRPGQLAALQGFPEWDWSGLANIQTVPLIGRAFPPPWAAEVCRSFLRVLVRRKLSPRKRA